MCSCATCPRWTSWRASSTTPLAVDAARAVLDRARDRDPRRRRARRPPRRARAPRSRRCGRRGFGASLNATGVIVHTNLGRAPLAAAALERVREVGVAATRTSSTRSRRARAARGRNTSRRSCGRLTGAEAALVVNNNAGAMLLALAALAEGREVLVSRGELIEIGDGFRIPDVLARSGARLVEVGTTNRTRAADYERGDRARDGADPARAPVELPRRRLHRPAVARRASPASRAQHGLPLVDDLGSGNLLPSNDSLLGDEPSARESLAAGADLVCFSGDKLLGGPQAGIVVGRAELVERLRRHPLQRALRADKLTLAALEGTLALYLDPALARAEIPVLRMVDEPAAGRARAGRAARRARRAGRSRRRLRASGGGALPLARARELRLRRRGVARRRRSGSASRRSSAIVRDGRLLLDCRTLADGEIDEVAAAVAAAR